MSDLLDTIRASLTGPVSSIRTPFQRDGDIDFHGLRRQIDFNIAAGSKTMLLTAGDSHYECLSDDEIAQVTRVTCDHTAGRAMVVAADRRHSTRRAVAFAAFARDRGASVVMCMPPDWGRSCTPASLAAHYAAVADRLPVMIVTNVFAAHGDDFGMETLRLTLQSGKPVVAVKDDVCGAFARRMSAWVYPRVAVISGGQKQNHLTHHPYGCDGYLSTFITFAPAVARRYWRAITQNDLDAAADVVMRIDMPFFRVIRGLSGGFDAGLHGVLELAEICGRWRRPPYVSLADSEMDRLTQHLRDLGVHDLLGQTT